MLDGRGSSGTPLCVIGPKVSVMGSPSCLRIQDWSRIMGEGQPILLAARGAGLARTACSWASSKQLLW